MLALDFPYNCQEDQFTHLADYENNLFVSCAGDMMSSFSAEKELRWEVSAPKINPFFTHLRIRSLMENSSLILATMEGSSSNLGSTRILAVNSSNGGIVWNVFLKDISISALLPASEKIWAVGTRGGSSPGTILIVFHSSGVPYRTFILTSSLMESIGPLAASSPFLFIATRTRDKDSWIYAFNMESLRVTWKSKDSWDNLAASSSLLITADSIKSTVGAYFPSNGSIPWGGRTDGGWFQECSGLVAIGPQEEYVFVTKPLSEGTVQVLAIDKFGKIMWRSDLPPCNVASGITLSQSAVHLVACGKIYALEITSGAIQWSHNISVAGVNCKDWAPTNPIVLSDGRILFSCRDIDDPYEKWHIITVEEDFARQLFLFLAVAVCIIVIIVSLLSLLFILRRGKRYHYRALS